MRVLQVTPSVAPSFGGPSHLIRVFFNLLNDTPGYWTDIIATKDFGEVVADLPLHNKKMSKSIKPSLYLFEKENLGSSWCYSRALCSWLEANIANYDVVHIHGLFAYPGLIAAKLCRKHDVPYCVSPMGMLDPWPFSHKYLKKKVFYELFQKRDLKNAAVIHATAQPEKNSILGFLPKAVVDIVPLSVDLPRAKATAPVVGLPVELLFMSRLDEKKGLPILLQALSLLNKEGRVVRLRIAGSGNKQYTSFLYKKVKALGIENSVDFIGFAEGTRKAQIFLESHLFVLPSYHENFGIVVAEALSYGLPVITTKPVALSYDIIKHGAGSRVSVDDPEALASAIRNLSSEDNWQECSDNAKQLADTHYSHSSLATGLLAMYDHTKTASKPVERQ